MTVGENRGHDGAIQDKVPLDGVSSYGGRLNFKGRLSRTRLAPNVVLDDHIDDG